MKVFELFDQVTQVLDCTEVLFLMETNDGIFSVVLLVMFTALLPGMVSWNTK